MYATLKSVINGEPVSYPMEHDTIGEMHEHAQYSCRAGLLAAVIIYQLATGEDPADILRRAYSYPDGTSIPYTIEFPGDMEDEYGLTDISPAALGKHHFQNMEKNPELKRQVENHVCFENPCKVRQLYAALELDGIIHPTGD